MKRFPGDFRVQNGVWRPRGGEPAGDPGWSEPERYLKETFESASDLSSDSQELALAVRDWPSKYHLSPLRANLLRVLDLRKGARVLELGCGAGALTRYFGETAGRVVAVDPRPVPATLARLRCRDLDNVDVVACRFDDIAPGEPADIVTLVGILEHAAENWRGTADPFEGMLRFARESLTPDGVLVVAIENKLGMKYFSGCVEDHLLKPFPGIEGYPDRSGPRTFGRQELIDLARRCGFTAFEMILPFPDYKLPSTFINARFTSAAESSDYNLADWCREPFKEYEGEREHLFCDLLALSSVAATGLLADFANSFLLLAGRKPFRPRSPVRRPGWVARGINILRRPEYRTITTVVAAESVPTILKKRIADMPPSPDSPVTLSADTRHPFIKGGKSLFMEMLRAIRRIEGGEEEFARLVALWADRLRRDALPGEDLLPAGHLDCLPSNLILDPEGTLHYVDEEWRWHRPVPLDWVLFRGLLQFWRKNRPWIDLYMGQPEAYFEEFLPRALAASGISIDRKRLDELGDMEMAFHDATSPVPPTDFRVMRKRRGKRLLKKAIGKIPGRPRSRP